MLGSIKKWLAQNLLDLTLKYAWSQALQQNALCLFVPLPSGVTPPEEAGSWTDRRGWRRCYRTTVGSQFTPRAPFWPQNHSLRAPLTVSSLQLASIGRREVQVKLSKCQQRLREGPQGRLLTSAYIYELWLGTGFFCLLMGNGEEILCPLSSTCSPVARPQQKVQLNTDMCWKHKGVTQWCCQPARAGRLYCYPALPHRGGSVGRFSPDTPGGQKETPWVLLEATP